MADGGGSAVTRRSARTEQEGKQGKIVLAILAKWNDDQAGATGGWSSKGATEG